MQHKFTPTKHLKRAALTLLALIMTCATAWADTENVTYIDADGNTQTVTATILTGSESDLGNWQTTWYVVNSNISYSSSIRCLSNVNIILADGKTMTVNSGPIGGDNLTIYGQSEQSGILNATNPQSSLGNAIQCSQNLIINGGTVNANCSYGAIFCGSSFTINRGTVNATSSTSSGYGIKADYVTINGGTVTTNAQFGIKVEDNGGITINGGNVTANGSWGIYAFCNITLGWSNASDRIYASRYYVNSGHTISIAEGKYFKDANSNNWFFGNVNASDIDGKTLQPATQAEYIQYYLGTGNDGSAQHPYTISDAISWNVFCDAFEDNDTWNHFSSGFSGKIVKLGANISVSRMAGNNDHPFTGTFDGDGKTLTFNYGSDGTPSNEDYIAPFRYTDGATISGLHVSGNIYTQHIHSAGIIGLASGTTTVSNCRSSINIISSINGDGTHGGLIACTWTGSTTNITGCLFDGSIQSASGYATDQCGGFVGWRYNTINVTNSLLTADLSTIGDDTGNYPSCTFVRSGVSSITNSYYTAALGTVQGKLRHSITAGANTTVANAGTATTYDVSGITSYGTGILYGGVLYAGNGDAVSLTLTHQDPPEGYTFNGYIPSAGTLNGTTLTMPDEDVTISAPWAPISYAITYNLEGGNLPTGQSNPQSYTIESNDIELVNPIKSGYNFVGWTGTGLNGPTQTVIIAHGSMGIREYTAIWSVSVNYINENGVEQTVTALPLTGSETILDPGWYVVENTNPNGVDLAYTEGLSCSNGNLNLILCDGAEMTVTGAYTQDAITLDGESTLTIYGQSQMSGKLTLTGSEYGKCIHSNSGSIVMNGGIVNATADTDGAIDCYSFTMNGGSFSATSNYLDSYYYQDGYAIQIVNKSSEDYGNFTFNGGNFSAFSAYANGIEGYYPTFTLSWTNTSDSFYVSSLGQVSINIAEGKDFIDEDNMLHTYDDPGNIVGKTLRPFNGCYLPKHLTANAITTSTATLTWEAGNSETQWQVSWSTDGGSNWSTPVTVNNVPQYEITSLSPETTVQAQVKSVCGESVYSVPISITFTTHSACDAPESLTATPIASSATLNWTGYQDSYNVRYCTVTFGDADTATEDFEHSGSMPEGWTKLDLGDGANTAELGISTDAAQNGTYGFRFSSFNGNSEGSFDQYLISPELNNLSALSFYYRASSTSSSEETFRVGYSTTTNDVSAFTWVSNGSTSSNEFSEFVVSNIPANAKYFAINYTAVYQYRLYIDNITYTYTPLIVGTWNETNTSVTSPLTISGLTPETPYAWQVQGSNCDGNGGTTEWSEMGTFTTQLPCEVPSELTATDLTLTTATLTWTSDAEDFDMKYAINPVFTFDFDDGTLQGWTNLIVNQDGGMWLHSDDFPTSYDYNELAHSGTGFALCYSYVENSGDAYNTNAYLVSPQSYQIYEGASLTFFYNQRSETWPEYFEVCVATAANPTASDFSPIWNLNSRGGRGQKTEVRQRNTRNENWREVTLDLSAYTGQTIWIAFHDVNNSMYEVWIDDVTINTGNITWIPVNESISTNQYTLTGLAPKTTYLVRVRANCDADDVSLWSNIATFTTLDPCEAPSELTATDITVNSATLSWSGVQDSYNVRYRSAARANEWQTINNIAGTTTTLNGLTPETPYQWQVQGLNCDGDGGTTDWSAIGEFTTQPLPAVSYIDENGEQQLCTAYTTITSSMSSYYDFTAGWYVVNSDVEFNSQLYSDDEIHLILCDGATLTVTEANYGININTLHIYGQALGTGTINAQGTSNSGIYIKNSLTINGGIINAQGKKYGIYAGNSVTINGGQVTANGQNNNGIRTANDGSNITINGGQVTAISGNIYGISCNVGAITLGWTNPTDYIYANSYNATATLSIAEGKTFKDVDGNTYESGPISASAINGKTLYPSVASIFTKTVAGYGTGNGGWVFIASPLAADLAPTAVAHLVATPATDYDLYRFNQSSSNGKEWQNWKQDEGHNNVAPGFSLVNGQGYLYASKETRTLVFAGEYTAATGPVEVPLAYDPDADLAGWNLVGNPFTVNATLTQPYYRMNEGGTALKTETEDTEVAAMEGVFVKANEDGEIVTFGAQTRGGEKAAIAQANIMVGGDNGAIIDNTIIRFDGGQTLEKFSFREGSTKIYFPQDGKDYAVVNAETTGEMPVNFKAEHNGTYTLSVNVDNMEMEYLHLIDNLTGADVDLLTQASYTFTAKTTDYESRFKLVFSASGNADDVFAFYSNGNWVISNEGRTTLQVIDINGRILSSEEINGSVSKAINATPGVYVMRLINGDNVRTQKIIVK